jgi:hypothetical protein
MKGLVAETVTERAAGEPASRTRALLAATFVAVGAGVVTYKLLRSGGGDN